MITKGLEDYLELIYTQLQIKKEIKAVDIANFFNISRSSVSEALIRLMDLDLIIYEGRKGIKITPKGEQEAKKIILKHNVLFEFFNKILKIDEKISTSNACKIEHDIDEAVIQKIKDFNNYCIKNSIHINYQKECND